MRYASKKHWSAITKQMKAIYVEAAVSLDWDPGGGRPRFRTWRGRDLSDEVWQMIEESTAERPVTSLVGFELRSPVVADPASGRPRERWAHGPLRLRAEGWRGDGAADVQLELWGALCAPEVDALGLARAAMAHLEALGLGARGEARSAE